MNASATGGSPSIYTKTGDEGTTGLLFGGRVSKADPVIEVCGALDEAVAALGLGRSLLDDEELERLVLELQRGLFAAAAEVAANPRARVRLVGGIPSLTPEMTASLERMIDTLLAEHPLRPAFVLSGATPASAALDLARTVLRRARATADRCARGGADGERDADRICQSGVGSRVRARPASGRRGRGAAKPHVTRATAFRASSRSIGSR